MPERNDKRKIHIRMSEDHLSTPFKNGMFGVEVTVEGGDMTENELMVAVCTRGKSQQRVPRREWMTP